MGLMGQTPQSIMTLLNVSKQYVSHWKKVYKEVGAVGLLLGYKGSQGYLTSGEQTEVVAWIQSQQSVSVEALRDHVAQKYEVSYQSKQSYYELLRLGGMSYHRTQAANPRRDEAQIEQRRVEIKKN
jgi:putative transposase